MKLRRALPIGLSAVALLAIGLMPLQTQEPLPDEVEPLARGPVHEAFAQPVADRIEEPDLAPKEPPAAIEEMPPDERPDGNNIQWLPGYWDWDEEQSEYLWVSGFWRDVPPDRRWVPGHWQEVEDGWMWTHGFWMDDDEDELEYVPPPPPSIEEGPSTPAPDDTSVYAPGCWFYQDQQYLWRPGYWMDYRPGWTWVPCQHVRSPGGCVFVRGYWDYPLHERGMLFSPVRVPQQLLARPQVYTPRYVVDTDFLLGALFVRAATRNYYFGDYFEDRYDRRGFVPWVDYRPGKQFPDQNYAYYRRAFRDNDGWDDSLRNLYTARRRGDVPRPPRTLVQQAQAIQNIAVNKTENTLVNKNINITNVQNVTALRSLRESNDRRVTALAGLGKARDAKAAPPPRVIKLQQVAREQRERQQEQAERLRQISQQRRKVEEQLHRDGGVQARPRVDQPRPQPQPQPQAQKPPRLNVPKPQPKATPARPPAAQPQRPAKPPQPQMPKPQVKPLPKANPPRQINPPKAKPDKPRKPPKNAP